MIFNFIYDNTKLYIDDKYNNIFSYQIEQFKNMIDHEILFRKIIIELINMNLIDKNKNIIDVGGYVGDNSLPWAKNINGLVYCVEPSNINIKFIEELKKSNSINNIKLFETCISDKEEILSTNDGIDMGHNLSFAYDKRKWSLIWNKNENKTNKINATTFDILYEKKEIDNITFIHIDVEGLELNVLNGSKKVIDIFRPIVVFEVHLNQPIPSKEDMINFFKNRNYIVYIIDERCGRKDCRNLLSIPNEYNNKIINSTFYKHLEKC